MFAIIHENLGWLMVTVSRLQRTRADQLMDAIGLYRGQASLLMMLAHRDGLTHSEIAEKLDISPAAATKAIQRMERAGYLRRQPDPADERVSRVVLEAPGRALTAEITCAFDELERLMFVGLSEAERAQFRQTLTCILANLQQPINASHSLPGSCS